MFSNINSVAFSNSQSFRAIELPKQKTQLISVKEYFTTYLIKILHVTFMTT